MINPLKFLDPYAKADIDSFFGRETEVELLYKKVKSNAITLFYGLSGTGKSSVIMCGLSNKFDDVDWMPYIVRRTSSQDMISAIRRSLNEDGTDSSLDVIELLNDTYYEHFRTIYLIFDQLEELFIYGDKVEKEEFITFLKILRDRFPFVRIILVLREEYLAHLSGFEESLPELKDSKLRLELMEERKVKDIIASWGIQLGLKIDDSVASIIVNRVRKKALGYNFPNYTESSISQIQLPYLQVYFSEILNSLDWKENGKEIILEEIHLPSLGEANDVLTDFIDLSVRDISKRVWANQETEEYERNVWQVLGAMVSYEGTKQAKGISEIHQDIMS